MEGFSSRKRAPAPGLIRLDIVFAVLTGLLVLFVLLPVLLLLPEAASGELRDELAEGGLGRAVAVSLGSATAATLLASCLGIPAGYLLAHSDSRGSWLTRAAIVLPTVLPPVASGVLLLNVYGPAGPIGALLMAGGWSVVNAFGGIVLAQLFVTVPFVVLTAEAAFRSVDRGLEEVAATLGQSRGGTFFRIALPLARYGVLAGVALAWMRALGEFGATVVLAYHPHSLPVYLWVELMGQGLGRALPVALVALAIAALALALAESLARAGLRRRQGGRTSALLGPTRAASEDWHSAYPAPAARRDGYRRRWGTGGLDASGRDPARLSEERGVLLDMELEYAVGDFTLQVSLEAGAEVLSLFGPSGAGKSTLLRLVAGLAGPGRGHVRIDAAQCADATTWVPVNRRPVGMVFQNPSLFPHMTVEENVLFGVSRQAPRRTELLRELLAITRLEGLERRLPAELSGGQQQRVALGRALARRPTVLLLDEPFSSLDFNMRERLHRDVRRIQRTYGLCVLFVTHDLRDACSLADRLGVVSEGRILQVGSPLDVLHRPASHDVARFVAVRNLLPGVVTSVEAGHYAVRCGGIELQTDPGKFREGEKIYACIRPEDVVLLKPDRPLVSPADENVLTGRVEAELLRGPSYTLALRVRPPGSVDGTVLEVELPVRSHRRLGVRVGDDWRVSLRRSAIHLVAG